MLDEQADYPCAEIWDGTRLVRTYAGANKPNEVGRVNMTGATGIFPSRINPRK